MTLPKGNRRTIRLGDGVVRDYPSASSPAAAAVMRGNRGSDTKPELAVRRALHRRGRRYRVHHPIELDTVRVRPDVVFTRARVAVFIDGCYWHGCPTHGTRARANAGYWSAKIARNRARDIRNDAALQGAGWRVVRAWEHEPVSNVVLRIEEALAARP